jgi:hypothetical protein
MPTMTAPDAHRKLRISRALDHLAVLNERQADYAASVDEWYRSGDGRSPEWVEAGTQEWFDFENDDPSRPVNIGGWGYRYPSCIHGRSLWVDYDCNCGPCEDSIPDRELALMLAHGDVHTYEERFEVVRRASALNAPRETVLALVDWAAEPIQPIDRPRPLDPTRLP